MPKVVDHQQRRRELAEAVWRVIRQDGIDAATVRTVAEESGWSAGALRHYFTTQAELLAFAMQLVAERVTARVRSLPPPAEAPRAAVERLLYEILPLDDERRAEAEVWLAFTARALVAPELRALHDGGDGPLHGLCLRVVETLVSSGHAAPVTDVEREADRLHALVDGLTLHALLQPGRMPAARVVAVVAHHLDLLRDGRGSGTHGRAGTA